MKTLFTPVLLALTTIGCLEKERPIWNNPETKTLTCENYASVVTELGVLTNNVWNKHAAENDSWSQCLETRLVDGKTQFGWSWSWPFGRNVIYAQPQVKIGSSPWAPEPKFDDTFPLKIADLAALHISHQLEIITNGEHNTANTMWLTTAPYTGNEPNKSIIAAEIMIWTYATAGHFDPAGRKHSEIEINDASWEVWYQKSWKDQSGQNENRWAIVSFRAKKSSMKAEIPALKLLSYAIQERLIAQDLYIADVELGNEVMSGSGLTWINEFEVVYRWKANNKNSD